MTSETSLSIGIIGGHEFGRRISSVLLPIQSVRAFHADYASAWAEVLAERPHAIVVDIGQQYSERTHVWLRSFLSQIRERLKSDIYIVLVLSACEKFAFGGDLLFASNDDFAASEWIDSFVVAPPFALPSIATVDHQLVQLIALIRSEFERRARGAAALPALASDAWVQALADPTTRELWMKWLPRYASYTNESPIIIGETGTGKTKLALALHVLSGRPGKFVSITPRDFSSSELVQAELFGAVAGAYTGAVDKWGLVKMAEKGTLFIDELQSIDKDLQGKLITFIENKIYRRVGSAESIEADVRFVFASNRTLHDLMSHDVLRDDFAYRLERVQLELHALKERRLDIPAALAFALAKIRRQRPSAIPVHGVSASAYRMLFCNSWPGNLRQLENTVARLCELADIEGSHTISDTHVAQVMQSKLSGPPASAAEVIARASYQLAERSLREHLSSLSKGIEAFSELTRCTALEAMLGDSERAAGLIADDVDAIRLLSSRRVSRECKA